jgi:hypothetical protein
MADLEAAHRTKRARLDGRSGESELSAADSLTVGTVNVSSGELIRVNGRAAPSYQSFYNNLTKQGQVGSGTVLGVGGTGLAVTASAGPLVLETTTGADMVLSTAATERLRVSSSGQIIFGVTNVVGNELLRVNGTNNVTYMGWYNNTTRQGYLGTGVGGSGMRLFTDASSLDLRTGAAAPIVFSINNTERLRLTDTGMLHLGEVNAATGELIKINGVAAQSYVGFYNNTTRQGYLGTDNAGSGMIFNADAGGLTLQTVAAIPIKFVLNAVERARIHTNGYLGVNFNAPSQQLDVNGCIRSVGNGDLPAAIEGNVIHCAGFSSPISGRTLVGDGTGWQWNIGKRTGSTTSDLASFTDSGNFVCGGAAALATNATTGFFHVPSMAGTPTGEPSAVSGFSGKVPMVVDTTNLRVYFRLGTDWRYAALT